MPHIILSIEDREVNLQMKAWLVEAIGWTEKKEQPRGPGMNSQEGAGKPGGSVLGKPREESFQDKE